MKSFFISKKKYAAILLAVILLTVDAIVSLFLGKKEIAEVVILIAGILNAYVVFAGMNREKKTGDKMIWFIDKPLVIDDNDNAYLIYSKSFLSYIIFITFMIYGYKNKMFGYDFEIFILFGLLIFLSCYISTEYFKNEYLKRKNSILYVFGR